MNKNKMKIFHGKTDLNSFFSSSMNISRNIKSNKAIIHLQIAHIKATDSFNNLSRKSQTNQMRQR